MKLILLLLSSFVSLTTAANETICQALEQHPYADLGLLSITWYYYGYGLLLFTKPHYRYYSLPIDKISYNSMDLSQTSPIATETDLEFKPAFAYIRGKAFKGAYTFYLRKYTIWPAWNYKMVPLLITDIGTLSGAFYKLRYRQTFDDTLVEVAEPDGLALPDFSLAGRAYDRMKDLSGFVLSSGKALVDPAARLIPALSLDYSRIPGIILLSEYKVLWDGSNVTGLPLRAGQTDDRPFFFLQVSDHPFEVFLIHSSNKPDPHAQLLRSVPRSFLFDKKHLVLFDMTTGCVHIIPDFGDFSVTETQSRTFRRVNLPFEVYFKCGRPLDNPNPNRCNVVRGSHRPTGVTPESPWTPSTESGPFSMGQTVTVCLVVAVLVVGFLYVIIILIMAKKKAVKGTKGKLAVKSTTSSLVVSGTSKIGSKRTASFGSKAGLSSTGNSSIIDHSTKSKFTSKVVSKSKSAKTPTSK